MIVPMLLLLVQTSQLPVPGPRVGQGHQPQRNPDSTQQPTIPDPRGTEQAPVIVKVQPIAKTDEDTAKDQRKEDREASAYRWQIGAVVATTIVGLLTLGMIGFQARIAANQNEIMRSQSRIMEGQRAAALEQTAHMQEGLSLTRDALAVSQQAVHAAQLNVEATVQNTDTAISALATNREIERAYISLRDDPKETNLLKKKKTGELAGLTAHIFIKNFGRTPGQVVGGYCGWARQKYRSEGPDLSKVHSGSRINAFPFLMPGERVDYWMIYDTDSEFMQAMAAKETDVCVWLVGEVDYRDAFGKIYRNGFGRIYSIDSERFIQEPSTSTLNYDRPLTDTEVGQRGY